MYRKLKIERRRARLAKLVYRRVLRSVKRVEVTR